MLNVAHGAFPGALHATTCVSPVNCANVSVTVAYPVEFVVPLAALNVPDPVTRMKFTCALDLATPLLSSRAVNGKLSDAPSDTHRYGDMTPISEAD